MVLPDTSIWVDYLRYGVSGQAADLDRLLEDREVVACGPVVAELLAGCGVNDRSKLDTSLRSLPWADLDRAGWYAVGQAAAGLRDEGRSVALTDIEIAVAAAVADAILWTNDRDFNLLGEVVPGLRLRGR